MSESETDPKDLADDELLERIASLDPKEYPLVSITQSVLDAREESS